jgi:hypothetical protein
MVFSPDTLGSGRRETGAFMPRMLASIEGASFLSGRGIFAFLEQSSVPVEPVAVRYTRAGFEKQLFGTP